MTYFLSPVPLRTGAVVIIDGPEAAHMLGARRLRPGEHFALQDGTGRRFLAELVEGGKGRATVRVLEPAPIPAPPALEVILLQAAVKEKAAEMIVQKATELGVAAIAFFPAERSAIARRQITSAKTESRWEKIAWEACKQCDRPAPPLLHILPDFPAALSQAAGSHAALSHAAGSHAASSYAAVSQNGVSGGAPAINWILDVQGKPVPRVSRPPASESGAARVLVGPEGGFTQAEVDAARTARFIPVRLSAHTLRAETAALAAAALLLCGE